MFQYKKYMTRIFLITAILSIISILTITSCSSQAPRTFPEIAPIRTVTSLADAQAALHQQRIVEYRAAWEDTEIDGFTRASTAFFLALELQDPAWSNEAIKRFEPIVDAQPDDAAARAFLGSAHALAARDYPLQGIWQWIIPGPGFARLYHVRRAFTYLDQAIEMTPQDPMIRFIRANTYTRMPAIFGGQDQGMADFALLLRWFEVHTLNPAYQDVLADSWFQNEVWLAYANILDYQQRVEEAQLYWQLLANKSEDFFIRQLTKWQLQK